ncbi:MAG: nicotinic acid mononucleotide adenylyltransferase [Ornithinibacter sp.]|jgi:nicotinate-nucleotide adenylyltransferase|nr:nicotinic acid mononucleotide adenylyltransferase [Ornithinibacter sp.]
MRTGVFGGTFDPIHRMHLLIARAVRRESRLDRVLFVPTGASSHRGAHEAADPVHRAAMISAACSEEPQFALCLVDVERSRPTYTIDTLTDLRRQFGPREELILVLGADNLAAIPTWHRGPELMASAHCIAVSRPGHQLVDPGFPSGRLSLVHVPPLRFSATTVRRRAALGMPIGALVPMAVERYIVEHDLYCTR